MAREARKLSSKGLYYIELKGDKLFVDKEDKEKFVELITSYFKDGGKIFAYSLISNKIKMVVKESKKGISMTMKPITTSYARYFNKKYGLTGSIFNGRFLSIPYETKKEADEKAREIEENITETKKVKKETVKKPVKKTAENTSKKPVKKEAPKNKEIKKETKKEIIKEEKKEEIKKPKNKILKINN